MGLWDITDKSLWELFVIYEVGEAMVWGYSLILGNSQTMVLAPTMGTRKG